MFYRYEFETSGGNFCAFFEDEALIGLELSSPDMPVGQKTEKYLAAYVPISTAVRKTTREGEYVRAWVNDYLAGQNRPFENPVELYGTDFNIKIWNILRTVDYGETATYGDLARAAGTGAYQAVGSAMAKNPVVLILPCHRILNSKGEIGNYSAGTGSRDKQKFLELENAIVSPFI